MLKEGKVTDMLPHSAAILKTTVSKKKKIEGKSEIEGEGGGEKEAGKGLEE